MKERLKMINIERLKEINYRLDNINTDNSTEALVVEYSKIKNNLAILEQKMNNIKIDILDIPSNVFSLAMDRVEEKLKHMQLEKLVNKTMECMVNEYSMESLSKSDNYYYVDIDSKLLIVTTALNKDGFYALQDIENLKKVVTTNFIENTILDTNIYNTKTMDMEYKGKIYNLEIDNTEKEFIQDGIYEHFHMDVNYEVDFDKTFIRDLEDGKYILNLAITFNSADWEGIISEIGKGNDE